MDSQEKVTVLMPVYNGGQYLQEAINSILNQTYHKFKFLIINDGSTDNSDVIIQGFNDSRIIYIENDRNIGIIKTLNIGIKLITSEYIVRMDADDISLPTRIEKQVSYMDANPDVAASGTSVLLFNDEGKHQKLIVNHNFRTIKTVLLFYNALLHPTVIMRKCVLSEGNYQYDENHNTVEDFGLWQNISFKHKLENLPEILVKYRINKSGITKNAKKNVHQSDISHMKIYKLVFDYLCIDSSDKNLNIYRLFISGRSFAKEKEAEKISKLLKSIKLAINDKEFDLKIFETLVCYHFRINCLENRMNYFEMNRLYNAANFKSVFTFNLIDRTKYMVRRYLRKETDINSISN